MKSKISDDSIRLNEIVENINWSNKDNLKVITYNNFDKKKREYETSKVLCTIPLGYLKRNHDRLFTPKLPSAKINSIENLGFGCVDKIFLVFDTEFERDFQGFQIFWRNDLQFYSEACNKWNLNVIILRN